MLDAGVCTICGVSWDESGVTKTRQLTTKVKGFYEERTVGFARHFEAGRNGQRVDKLIRIWRAPVNTRDICMIHGVEYAIRQVQHKKDEDGLLVTDLSLEEYGDGEN